MNQPGYCLSFPDSTHNLKSNLRDDPMPHGHSSLRPSRCIQRTATLLTGLALLLAVTACQPQSKSPSDNAQEKETNRLARQQSVRDHLERTYTIGPVAAGSFNYTVRWQFPVPSRQIRFMSPQNDRLFILTNGNDLICLQASDGQRIWTVSVAKELQEVHSVTYIKSEELVLVLADNKLLTLDSNTGLTRPASLGTAHQNLEWIANSGGVVAGEYLIYGSRSGQLIWQAWKIGFAWRAYQVAHAIKLNPVISGRTVCCVSPSGVVASFSIGSASQLWRTELLDAIVAEPVASNRALYVAGIDQHLRAFDLGSGRVLWRVLTESSLVDSPVYIGDRIYQQIPGKGLASFTALPINKLDGERNWTCPQVGGNVVTRTGDALVTWDPNRRILSSVSATQGTHVHSLDLPNVANVIADNVSDGILYAISHDGHLVCLSPMH